jgi:hypothetical protein
MIVKMLDDTNLTPTLTAAVSSLLQIRGLNPLVKSGILRIECRLPEAKHLKLNLYSLAGQRTCAANSTLPGGVSTWGQELSAQG